MSGASRLLRGPAPEGGEGREEGKECREGHRDDRVWGEIGGKRGCEQRGGGKGDGSLAF